jgi:hypothetical protein
MDQGVSNSYLMGKRALVDSLPRPYRPRRHLRLSVVDSDMRFDVR